MKYILIHEDFSKKLFFCSFGIWSTSREDAKEFQSLAQAKQTAAASIFASEITIVEIPDASSQSA